jgi:hypothetical protein
LDLFKRGDGLSVAGGGWRGQWTKYKYFAISADQTQWELGEGAYNTTGPVLPRTTILFNSLGTTAKINFAAAPQVAIVALADNNIAFDFTKEGFYAVWATDGVDL